MVKKRRKRKGMKIVVYLMIITMLLSTLFTGVAFLF